MKTLSLGLVCHRVLLQGFQAPIYKYVEFIKNFTEEGSRMRVYLFVVLRDDRVKTVVQDNQQRALLIENWKL